LSDEFHFELPIEVRFRDVDAFGHVNNAVYFTYMEQARIGYMRAAGLAPKSYEDTWFIIAEATCQFKAPSPFGASLVVKVRVPELRRSSFLMEYRIEERSTRRLIAMGRTVNVAYDYAAGKSRPIPPDWRAKIEQLEGNSPLIDGSMPSTKRSPV
jgi:acyl-CoA thioester hydrolase